MASFYAKRLSLVEQMEKNGLNKEISSSRKITGEAVYLLLTQAPAKDGFNESAAARLGDAKTPANSSAAAFQAAVTTMASPSAARLTFQPQACASRRV